MRSLGNNVIEGETLSYRPVFLSAVLVILCLTVSLLSWGLYARLDSAVVAPGVVLAESERKSVEHLEGGILAELLVEPGDRVEEGQVVAQLDATQISEQIAQLRIKRDGIVLDVWRLSAEEAGLKTLASETAPPVSSSSGAIKIAETRALFDARRRGFVGRISALRYRIEQQQAERAAHEDQFQAAEAQRALWQSERDLTKELVVRGASSSKQLLDLDRNIAVLTGQRDEARNLARAATEDIAAARSEIEAEQQQWRAEVTQDLTAAKSALEEVESQIRMAEDVLDRHDLRAPQAGLVVDISTRTRGAVLASGMPLMDIVPAEDRLVVQARIQPDAIDTVFVGRPARISLSAYKRAMAPILDGEVIYLSADMLEDERDGTAYFDARINIDADALAAADGFQILAGMPVEVAITTGKRRAGDYFLEPFLRHLGRAFNEE